MSQSTWDNVLTESQRQHLMVTILRCLTLVVVAFMILQLNCIPFLSLKLKLVLIT